MDLSRTGNGTALANDVDQNAARDQPVVFKQVFSHQLDLSVGVKSVKVLILLLRNSVTQAQTPLWALGTSLRG